jgi:phosphohistidine phosphatase
MRRLMLLRHAKTERTSASGMDRDRRLDERGRIEAPEMGRYMASNGLVPEVMLVSPATRTRESALLVGAQFHPEPALVQIADLYGADAGELLRVVRDETPAKAKTVVVIGHNPGLHEFALALTARDDPKAAALDNFPTAALAVIDFAVTGWEKIAPHAGRLERFVSPRVLREGEV